MYSMSGDGSLANSKSLRLIIVDAKILDIWIFALTSLSLCGYVGRALPDW